MAASACNPCVFGAVQTTLLSYPISVGTVEVQVIPHITIAGNGSASTSLETSTVAAATTPVAGSAAGSVVTVTTSGQLTWVTSGATLTYPTTYVDYAAFAGAAVTGTGCAQSLSPTILTLAPSVTAASLIYPVGGAVLPSALLNYLDSNGIPAQLNGDQLTTCGTLSNGLPPASSASSVLTVVTGVTSSPVTVTSNIPPPTTFTSEQISTFSSLSNIPASAATQTSVYSFVTNTGGAIYYSGGVSTSLPASAQFESLGSSAKSSLSSALSSLSTSKYSSLTSAKTTSQTGIFTNTTSGQTKPSSRGTIAPTASSYKASTGILPSSSKTSGPALYSGAASRHASSNSLVADLFGFVAFLLML